MGSVADLLSKYESCIGDAMWAFVERYDLDKEHNQRIVHLFGSHMHLYYMSDIHVVQPATYPLVISRGLRYSRGLERGNEPIIAYDGPSDLAPRELIDHVVVNKDLTNLIKRAIATDLQNQM